MTLSLLHSAVHGGGGGARDRAAQWPGGAEIVDRLHAMEAAGLSQVMLLPSLDKQYEALTDISREVLAKL